MPVEKLLNGSKNRNDRRYLGIKEKIITLKGDMRMSFQDPTVKVRTVPESVLQQSSPDANEGGHPTKKWICGIAGILVGLVIVAGTVLLAVYFGGKTATGATKEYTVSLQKNDGTKATETISVTGTEEKYRVDGGDYEVVYDTENGFAVYKTLATDHYVCFIRPLQISEVAKPDMFKNVQNGTTLSEESLERQYTGTYTTNGFVLKNRDLLSPMAREICEGSPVMWLGLAKEREGGRKKRRAFVHWYVGEGSESDY